MDPANKDGGNSDDNNDEDDGLLDEFFSQIERLSITGDGGGEHKNENESDPQHCAAAASDGGCPFAHDAFKGRNRSRPETKPRARQLRESVIDRAEERKGAWTAFSIPDAKQATTTNSNGRPLVSFSIGTKQSKQKKKNKPAKGSKPAAASPPPVFAPGGDGDCGDETSRGPLPRGFLPDRPALPPRWIVVLDTCALLESYGAVCDLLDLAREAEAVRAQGGPCCPPAGGSRREALSLVVPYTVWGELDHRSKESSGKSVDNERESDGDNERESDSEHKRFQARRAVRMLAEELGHRSLPHQPQLSLPRGAAAGKSAGGVLRTQSRAESHRAVGEFLFGGSVTNDDRILACALGEQKRYASERLLLGGPVFGGEAPVGGVVLATSDKVLSGKSRADGVVALAPEEFAGYYRRRMASLRSRTHRRNASAEANKPPRWRPEGDRR